MNKKLTEFNISKCQAKFNLSYHIRLLTGVNNLLDLKVRMFLK